MTIQHKNNAFSPRSVTGGRPIRPCYGGLNRDYVVTRQCVLCDDHVNCAKSSAADGSRVQGAFGGVDPNGLSLHEPGAKADAGKQLAAVLLDFGHALGAVADVGTMGANKYSRGGWMSVPNGETRYLDAAMRHLLKHGQGEENDPESGLPHMSHATWNLLAVMELRARGEAK